MRHKTLTALGVVAFVLAGCGAAYHDAELTKTQTGGEDVAVQSAAYTPLKDFPRRSQRTSIAVYDFPDLTGALAKNDSFSELGKSVSQGADAYVVAALREVGDGSWFRVVERRFLEPVLQERRLITGQATEDAQRAHTQSERTRIKTETDSIEKDVEGLRANIYRDYGVDGLQAAKTNLPPIEQTLDTLDRYRARRISEIGKEIPFSAFVLGKPVQDIIPADYLITGAIVSYDHDVINGGGGLRLANFGVKERVRRDIITVNLRLVDVSTSEIIAEETVTQAVESRLVQGNTMTYVTLDRILEAEAGTAINEPKSFALDAALRVALSSVLRQWTTGDRS